MILRPYQQQLYDQIHHGWSQGYNNVIAVAQTGSGKSVLLSEILKNHTGMCAVMAHTSELIHQLSLLLAHREIKHRIIAPNHVVKDICKMHITEYNRCWYDPNAPVFVISAPTMVRRLETLRELCNQVTLWICDETQHLLRAPGMWGKCVEAFPNAKGLGVTATPERCDGKGLGQHADGVYDYMVEGPTVRDLIGAGYLSDYRMYAPVGVDTTGVTITASGDFNQKQLSERTDQSTITGDVVTEYQRLGDGRQGITFAVNVQNAEDITQAYNSAGIRAALVTAKTPANERFKIMRDYRAGLYTQLVNVATMTEGVDVPQVGVVSLARPTMSLGLFLQMVGRALRVSKDGKPAVIIDHGGNLLRHGAPDEIRQWTLDRRTRKSQKPDDVQNVSVCPSCAGVYLRSLGRTCPYCGEYDEPVGRALPEHVEGELQLLTPEALAQLRGTIAEANRTPEQVYNDMRAMNMSEVICRTNRKRQGELLELRAELTEAIRGWGEERRSRGQDDNVSYREFWLTYGVDVLSAQALNRADTDKLIQRLNGCLQ